MLKFQYHWCALISMMTSGFVGSVSVATRVWNAAKPTIVRLRIGRAGRMTRSDAELQHSISDERAYENPDSKRGNEDDPKQVLGRPLSRRHGSRAGTPAEERERK